MNTLELQHIAKLSGGRLVGDGALCCTGISTDTRAAVAGTLFVALRGANFDGHDYVDQALQAGAVAALVGEAQAARWAGANLVAVDDTLTGLQRLAGGYRQELPMRIVGITGSNGKTSTKQMCLAVLQAKFAVAATKGNLNNHIGVPLTLLSFSSDLQYGVVEAGMNHAGEIAPLAALARPDIGIVTNVGRAHIEFLGSREAIAEEKGALLRELDAGGLAIVPAADEYLNELLRNVAARQLTVGIGCGEVQATEPVTDGAGMRFTVSVDGQSAECKLPLPGRHMAGNALFAIATGWSEGIPLVECCEALAQLEPAVGRLSRRMLAGITLLDDSYNANPDSMLAALDVLATVQGKRKWAVLGAMAELGEFAASGYAEVGTACANKGIDGLLAVGRQAAGMRDAAVAAGCRTTELAEDVQHAAAVLDSWVEPDDVVLIKGSRSAALEKVIDEFSRLRGTIKEGVI